MPRLKENNVYRFLQMRYQKFLDYTRSRSLQTTTSSLELAFQEEVLLARHATRDEPLSSSVWAATTE